VISSVGSLGTAKNYGTSKSVSLTVPHSVPAGRLIVVWFSSHSVFSVFTPTDGEDVWGATDSAGNTYVNIGSQTHKGGFEKTGPMGLLFVCQLRHALTTSDTITVRTDTGLFSGSNWAKSMSVEEFNIGGGRFCLTTSAASKTLADTTDPASISTTVGGDPPEALWLHLLAQTAPSTDSMTWDSDYTQIAPEGFNSGTLAEDISLWGGYRIATLSSDTVDVADTTAARTNVQLFRAIVPIPDDVGPFPLTPVVDDFNRADESPADGGIWQTVNARAFGADHIQVTSNQAHGAGGSGAGGSQTIFESTVNQCMEVHAAIPVFGGGAHIHYATGGDSGAATFDGIGAAWSAVGPGESNPLFADYPGRLRIGRSGLEGRVGFVFADVWAPSANGVKFGLRRSRGVYGFHKIDHWFLNYGGGWEEVAAVTVDTGSLVGPPFEGAFALAVEDTTARADDFGYGITACRDWMPEFIRRPWEYQGTPPLNLQT